MQAFFEIRDFAQVSACIFASLIGFVVFPEFPPPFLDFAPKKLYNRKDVMFLELVPKGASDPEKIFCKPVAQCKGHTGDLRLFSPPHHADPHVLYARSGESEQQRQPRQR